MAKKKLAITLAVLAVGVVALVSLIAVQALLSQRTASVEPTPEELRQASKPDQVFAGAIDTFAYKTASQVLRTTDGNVNYSPLSLYYALAMTASGAAGDTLQEFLTVLEVPNSDMLSEQSNNLYRYLYNDKPNSRLKLANSLWVNSRYPIKPDFVEAVAQRFYAGAYNVWFGTAQADKKMSKWVQEQTQGAIAPSITTGKEQMLAIFNTIYFFAEWQEDFAEEMTIESDFYPADGTKQKNDFMRGTDSESSYLRGEGFIASSRKLKNGNSMVFILPDEGTAPRELIATPELTRTTFEGGERHKADVNWEMPKFSLDNTVQLVEPLRELGLVAVFRTDADLSIMSEMGAFVDSITQMAHIAVDENGVTAAAFTDVSMSAAAIPEEVEQIDITLDRPFIYAIQAPDGGLLFVGICDNPAQQ